MSNLELYIFKLGLGKCKSSHYRCMKIRITVIKVWVKGQILKFHKNAVSSQYLLHGHVAYQINGIDDCSNMLAHIMS